MLDFFYAAFMFDDGFLSGHPGACGEGAEGRQDGQVLHPRHRPGRWKYEVFKQKHLFYTCRTYEFNCSFSFCFSPFSFKISINMWLFALCFFSIFVSKFLKNVILVAGSQRSRSCFRTSSTGKSWTSPSIRTKPLPMVPPSRYERTFLMKLVL